MSVIKELICLTVVTYIDDTAEQAETGTLGFLSRVNIPDLSRAPKSLDDRCMNDGDQEMIIADDGHLN